MKKYFSLVMIVALIAGLSACSIKVEKTVEVTETKVVNVTDASGEVVTDASGEAETQVVTVPVTEVVTDKQGETVTQKDGTPVTQAVKETVTKADKTEAKTTVNWRDKYKTNDPGSSSATSADKGASSTTSADAAAIEEADQEAIKTPFNQSVDLGGSSSYKAGDYTKALKKLINGNSYTMAVVLDFKGLEGVEMKDATLIAYVDGDRKAYHYTADLSAFTEEVNEDDLKDMTDVSGFDMSSLFKNMKNLKIHMIMKNGKFYMVFPQLNIYMEVPQDEVDSMLDEQIDTILLDGELIKSETGNGMVRESFKTDDGSIVYYYYKNAMFSRIDVEAEGKTNTVLRVNSVTKGVKNKLLIFSEPYATQIKIDADAF